MTNMELKDMSVIRETVAGQFGISVVSLNARSRTEPLATIRHVAMFLCAELTGASRTTIGTMFNRDHSNITHAIISLKALCETDHHWARNVFEASRRCKLALGRPSNPPAGSLMPNISTVATETGEELLHGLHG